MATYKSRFEAFGFQVPGEQSFTDEEWASEVDWLENLALEEAPLIFSPHAIDSPYQVNNFLLSCTAFLRGRGHRSYLVCFPIFTHLGVHVSVQIID